MEVRDPIHGAVHVSDRERAVLDSPYFQRLRNIKQVGFTELAFPGATHSRYLHSVGVMHLAGAAFDAVFRRWVFSSSKRKAELRQCVRLAALLHDVGHAPFSHCTEFAMPPLVELGIAAYPDSVLESRGAKQASHEDYTVGILTLTDLTQILDRDFACGAIHVAALISPEIELTGDFFVDGGLDLRTVLSQIISSELDVDRLDYLVRDSFFSGARYGQVDVDWILSNLCVHRDSRDQVCLALDRKALYAFDHFILARYHMFVMVYFHHKSVVFEEMLRRYFETPGCPYALPASMETYLNVDDAELEMHLRQSRDPWARAVSEKRAWKRVLELHGSAGDVDTSWALGLLEEEGIRTLTASSVGRLSRYTVYGQKKSGAANIYVIEDSLQPGGRETPLHEATAIFARYRDARRIARIYVAPQDREEARRVLQSSERMPELF
ncbi:MAG: HD superfamily phosphohydrolase [Cognaticolwellia sp.]|jgi:HD superfamily phosphohydrolase